MKAFRIQADLLKLFQKIVIYQFHAVKTGIADRFALACHGGAVIVCECDIVFHVGTDVHLTAA